MKEKDEFIAHGAYTVCNAGGFLIELSSCGEMARIKDNYGSDNPEVSDWKEIAHIPDEEDPDGDFIAVIDPEGYNINLNLVMRL